MNKTNVFSFIILVLFFDINNALSKDYLSEIDLSNLHPSETPSIECTFNSPITNLSLIPQTKSRAGQQVASIFIFPSLPDRKILVFAHTHASDKIKLISIQSEALSYSVGLVIKLDGNSVLEITSNKNFDTDGMPIITRSSTGICVTH